MRLRIGYEIDAQIAAVTHTFDHFQLRFQSLRLFDVINAVLANLLHRLSNDVADSGIAVSKTA